MGLLARRRMEMLSHCARRNPTVAEGGMLGHCAGRNPPVGEGGDGPTPAAVSERCMGL